VSFCDRDNKRRPCGKRHDETSLGRRRRQRRRHAQADMHRLNIRRRSERREMQLRIDASDLDAERIERAKAAIV